MTTVRAKMYGLWYYLCIDLHWEPFMYPAFTVAYIIEPAGGRTATEIANYFVTYLQRLPEFSAYELQVHELK